MTHRTIAIISDFGLADPFVGVMKGVILSLNSSVQIVDITHQIPPQDVLSAAFLLKYSYRYFPKGSVFLVVVDPKVGSLRRAIIVETESYFFVGPDNGVLSLSLESERIKAVVEIKNRSYFLPNPSFTFHGRDIFAPVCAHISLGTPVKKFGTEVKRMRKLRQPPVRVYKNRVVGRIAYIDRFGNLITDISRELFEKSDLGGDFVIRFKRREIRSLSRSYAGVKLGGTLAIFDSFNALEIAVNRGSAKEAFSAEIGDEVEVIFERRNRGQPPPNLNSLFF